MNDETPADAVPVDANPAPEPTGDETTSRLPAHETDENPEEHMGRTVKDPWADNKATDWPNNEKMELDGDA